MKKFKESVLDHPKPSTFWKEEMAVGNHFLHPGQLSSRINS